MKCSNIFDAIYSLDDSCVKKALKHMDVNETNENGDAPLHLAIRLKYFAIIPMLIKKGADIFQMDGHLLTPRALADSLGYERIAHGFDLLELENRRLVEAISDGDLQEVKNSFRRGVALGARNTRADTPLHLAARYNQVEIGKFLVQNGAQLNAKNYLRETPLHEAAFRGFHEFMKLLVEHRAKVNLLNTRRETALDLARLYDNQETIQLLKSYGAQSGSRCDSEIEINSSESSM